jgi:hypothetical protein
MNFNVVLLGALLIAAPVFSQDQDLLGFLLNDTPAQVRQRLGRPVLVAPFGEFESWQYQVGVEDNHEFSHVLLFRVATGELVSVTRNWEQEQLVDELFPAAESKVYYYPDAGHPEYGVRVRRLTGGRVLIAMGSAKAGDPTGQIVAIRESELAHFHPWLATQLN